MAQTIAEILGLDLGDNDATKTASQNNQVENNENSSINKLAMSLGLTEEKTSGDTNSSQENTGHNKEASMKGMRDMYDSMFPSDSSVISGAEKVASANNVDDQLTKEAAEAEFAIGERAFEHFENLVDGHITKMASAVKAEMERHDNGGQMQNNEVKGNKSPSAKGDDHIADSAMGTSPKGAVGHFENRSSPNGEVKTAALQKAMLQFQVNLAKGEAK